jgi:hypothetical protein
VAKEKKTQTAEELLGTAITPWLTFEYARPVTRQDEVRWSAICSQIQAAGLRILPVAESPPRREFMSYTPAGEVAVTYVLVPTGPEHKQLDSLIDTVLAGDKEAILPLTDHLLEHYDLDVPTCRDLHLWTTTLRSQILQRRVAEREAVERVAELPPARRSRVEELFEEYAEGEKFLEGKIGLIRATALEVSLAWYEQGRRLTLIKKEVGWGAWMQWLASKNISHSTSRRYRRIYLNWAVIEPIVRELEAESKSPRAANLSLVKVLRLLDQPDGRVPDLPAEEPSPPVENPSATLTSLRREAAELTEQVAPVAAETQKAGRAASRQALQRHVEEIGQVGSAPFVEQRAPFDDPRKDWDDAKKAAYGAETGTCWRCNAALCVKTGRAGPVVVCNAGCENPTAQAPAPEQPWAFPFPQHLDPAPLARVSVDLPCPPSPASNTTLPSGIRLGTSQRTGSGRMLDRQVVANPSPIEPVAPVASTLDPSSRSQPRGLSNGVRSASSHLCSSSASDQGGSQRGL